MAVAWKEILEVARGNCVEGLLPEIFKDPGDQRDLGWERLVRLGLDIEIVGVVQGAALRIAMSIKVDLVVAPDIYFGAWHIHVVSPRRHGERPGYYVRQLLATDGSIDEALGIEAPFCCHG